MNPYQQGAWSFQVQEWLEPKTLASTPWIPALNSQLTPGGSIRASTVASLQTEHRTQVSHRLDAPYCWSSVSSSSSCHEAHAWVNVVVLLLARFHGNPIPSNLRAVDASYWLRGTISWGQKLPVRRAAGAWRALPHLSLCPPSLFLSVWQPQCWRVPCPVCWQSHTHEWRQTAI